MEVAIFEINLVIVTMVTDSIYSYRILLGVKFPREFKGNMGILLIF